MERFTIVSKTGAASVKNSFREAVQEAKRLIQETGREHWVENEEGEVDWQPR